jgi:hypothetical protein
LRSKGKGKSKGKSKGKAKTKGLGWGMACIPSIAKCAMDGAPVDCSRMEKNRQHQKQMQGFFPIRLCSEPATARANATTNTKANANAGVLRFAQNDNK